MAPVPVAPSDSTYAAISKKVRRLTASSSESALKQSDLDEYINTYWNQDFPYSIKLDQLRSVYTFYTSPNVDRYPLDINNNQGIRAPVYVDGIPGLFFKNRDEFYRMWPRYPTKFQQGPKGITGTITNITQAANAVVTSPLHGLTNGDYVTFQNVGGMTAINGLSTFITFMDVNNFSCNTIDSTAPGFNPYTAGGSWFGTSRTFSFAINPTPFLSSQVTLGGTDVNGTIIRLADDGGSLAPNGNNTTQGNILFIVTDTVGDQTPPAPALSPLQTTTPANAIGTVNYVTGQFGFTLPVALKPGTLLEIFVSQYQTAKPYSLLFWNNEFTIRPIPKLVHRIEVETYLTPAEFLKSSDSPTLNQWWQLIAIGAAIKILEDRQDMEGVQNLSVLYDRQAGLVLERQGIEEIGQRNTTIFSGSQQGPNWNAGWWGGWN